jgi:hypothetical protein
MNFSFKDFLVEEEKTVYMTFGRMNPPTIGHGKLMDKLASTAGKNPYRIFLSQSSDPKKNPLDFTTKVKFVRKMFPKHARSVMMNKKVKNALDASVALYNEGFRNLVMIVGSDRLNEFKALLERYNGKEARHGFYNFQSIKVVSAGDRDPDAEGVEGMSASKMRQFAADNDFTSFAQGLPRNSSNKESMALFNAVRRAMGLKEKKEFHRHVQLEKVSDTREQFVSGFLFNEGDTVRIKDTQQEATIIVKGANYLVVESEGEQKKVWISAVELIEKTTSPQDPDIKDRKGTQPKAYHAGIKSKSTKAARDAHFKKGAKMDDDNPAAYKKAPGDATAKTKPSKHTKKFKQMFGEDVSQKQISDLEKFADRLLNKFDVDIEFTRHFADRMNDARNNPKIAIPELQRLFKKIARNKAKNIKKHGDMQVVLKDIQSDLNLPVVVNYKNGEFEVVNKTIMRKKDFKTSNATIKYENQNLNIAKAKIEKEKKADKLKHQRMKNRAKMMDTIRKNKEQNK